MKVIGRAVAKATGYYPVSENGNCALINEGQEFDLYEGFEKGKWFERIGEQPARKGRSKPESPPPAASDIA